MIKINLLPQKRTKLRSTPSDPSAKHIGIGVAALVAAGAAVFLLVDQPKRRELADLEAQNADLRKSIAMQKKELDGYEAMLKANTEARERKQAIDRLLQAKVVPAHILHELGEILTTSRLPTMTID